MGGSSSVGVSEDTQVHAFDTVRKSSHTLTPRIHDDGTDDVGGGQAVVPTVSYWFPHKLRLQLDRSQHPK